MLVVFVKHVLAKSFGTGSAGTVMFAFSRWRYHSISKCIPIDFYVFCMCSYCDTSLLAA